MDDHFTYLNDEQMSEALARKVVHRSSSTKIPYQKQTRFFFVQMFAKHLKQSNRKTFGT